ncbi:MAG TPA: alpha/beta hydrolase [Solirubrobacteraceae bacterium]|jgi:pimeloyl-ACP methyl ester carboxylesterase
MRLSTHGRRRLLLGAAAALALAGAAPAAAQTPLPVGETSCQPDVGAAEPDQPKAVTPKGAQCLFIAAPLDHSGQVPGTVKVAFARVPATGTKQGALVFLAGGPGEPAIALSKPVTKLLKPLRASYDLIFVDQRGTGQSDAVKCGSYKSLKAVARCGEELGARRAFWTTRETAYDLEDIRAALGEPKLTVMGVSYGTAVAGEYARRFPASTGGLILDSPVPVDGQDIFEQLLTLGLPRVLKETCWPPSCRDFVADPVAALRALVRKVSKTPLRGTVVQTDGAERRTRMSVDDLYNLVASSDKDPLLRAELPAAIASAVLDDPAPILRLLAGVKADGSETGGIAVSRLLATNCVEGRLPWAPDSPLEARAQALTDFIAGTPASTFAPFGPKVVTRNSLAAACLAWPATPRPEGVPQQGPDVPVLVLSGRADLRTPLEDARRTGSQYPNARVLAVPEVGHSVLANDESGCALAGVVAFAAGQPVQNCDRSKIEQIERAPFIPASVDDLAPGRGLPKRVGRTATAVLVTLLEIERAADLRSRVSPGGRYVTVAGLRGGTVRFDASTGFLRLRAFEVVRGVRVSGTVPPGDPGRITVTAPRAITGTFRVRRSTLRGTLGGEPVVIRLDD